MCKSQTRRIKHGNEGSSIDPETRKGEKEVKKKHRKKKIEEIHPNLSGITVIENRLNSPMKRKILQNYIKIISSIFKSYPSRKMTLKGQKLRGEKIDWTNTNQNKADVAIPIPEKEFM